jgi:tetratricopeptide (TPR) repeat protein
MMPNMAYFAHVPLEIYLYFHQWKEILDYKLPAQSPTLQTYWHFCRAMAYASTGDVESALQESNLMKLAKQQIPPAETISNNPASKVLEVAETLLSATIARVQNHPEKFMDDLHQAIALQDQLYYDEPPAWTIPLRQTLGAALLRQEKYAEAENVFKHALRSLQRNGRSLFGLWLSLKGQERPIDAYWVKREMTAALQNASKPLTLDDL